MDESKKELSVLMRNMLRNVQSAKRDKVVIGKHSIVNNTSSETIVIPDSEAPEDQEACVEDDGGRGGEDRIEHNLDHHPYWYTSY